MTFGNLVDMVNINKIFYKPQCAILLLNASIKGGGSLAVETDSDRVNNWLKSDFKRSLYNLVFKKGDGLNDFHEFDSDAFLDFIKTRLGGRAEIRKCFAETWPVVNEYSDEDFYLFITYQFVKVVDIPPAVSSFEEYRGNVKESAYQRILDEQKEILNKIQDTEESILQALDSNKKKTLNENAEGHDLYAVHAEKIDLLIQKVNEVIDSNRSESSPSLSEGYPLFVAAPCLFSPITDTKGKHHALYRCGYNDHSAFVLKGVHGSGQFAVVSNDYVLRMEPINEISDVPQSLKEMLFRLITDLGGAFSKKKIGFTYRHGEFTSPEKIDPGLKGMLLAKGIKIEKCAHEMFETCDVIVVSSPGKSLNEDERDALIDYLYNGGNVLLCGNGYYWSASNDENGEKRKIEDFPINKIGRRLGFQIESSYKGKLIEYKYKSGKRQLFFTPLQLNTDTMGQFGGDAAELINNYADDGDVKTQSYLGACFEDGNGVPQNRDYALYWYKMSAFGKSDSGQYMLAMWYRRSNPSLFKIWLLTAAENGNNAAFGQLGLIYYYGTHGIKKNQDLGFTIIKRSVENGYDMAGYYLGIIFTDKEMHKEAADCFINACYGNNSNYVKAASHYQLGLLLKNGLGCSKDLYKAQTHFKLSAELKYSKAKSALELLDGELKAALQNDLLLGWGEIPAFTSEVFEGTRYYSFPDDEKDCLLKWLNDELALRIGEKIGNYLTAEQLIIFDKICDNDKGIIEAECARLKIADVYEYRVARTINPHIDEFTLKADILCAKWLSLYAPDESIRSRNEFIGLKNDLIRGEIDIALDAARITYTSNKLPPRVRWNSLTGQPGLPAAANGDERNFVWIRQYNTGEYQNQIVIESGKQYEVMLYYHNNAGADIDKQNIQNTVMFRAAAKSSFPNELTPQQTGIIRGELRAHNAATVWSEAKIVSNEAVALEFIAASAKLYNNSTKMSSPAGSGRILPSSLFSEAGTLIGWHNLDGVLPGGAMYSGRIKYVLNVKTINS